MGMVKLSDSTFAVCPEGEHVFIIKNVEHDEKFGTIKLVLKTPDGYTDTERYQLTDSNGNLNEGAAGAFSYMARCAMGNQNLTEVDPLTLKGHYVKGTITHDVKESTRQAGKKVTFTQLSNIESATAEEFNSLIPAQQTPPAQSGAFNLDAILGQRK